MEVGVRIETGTVDVPSNNPGTTPSKPAWGALASASPAPQSLEDVMSEELAKKIQSEEEKGTTTDIGQPEPEVDLSQFQDTSDDFLLAQMLQNQFNQEYDNELKRQEDHYNGTSKVKVSFSNYWTQHPAQREEDEEEIEETPEETDVTPKFKRGGISGKGKNIVTKHDAQICGTKNANRAMDTFPPDFETGDTTKDKVRLPNKVYNKLKVHSMSENKKRYRLHEKKEHSTAVMAVDEKTRLLLYKLMNNQLLEEVNGVISTGKEAVVLHASGGKMNDAIVPPEVALKVYKTTLSDFKTRGQYIKGDIRFMKDNYKKQNPRIIIKIWAEKEDRNLKLLEKHGIPCPRVVCLKKHVLVMSFIGRDGKPAPKLKDAELSTADTMLAYEQCITAMRRMYQDAGLVHADLSEYNMLWQDDTLYIIDVSQAVDKMHPHSLEFLLRDCANVTDFFRKAGVPDVPSQYELFNDITGMDLKGEGQEFLQQVEEYEKNEELLQHDQGKHYPFDYFFDMATRERLEQATTETSTTETSTTETDDIETRGSEIAGSSPSQHSSAAAYFELSSDSDDDSDLDETGQSKVDK